MKVILSRKGFDSGYGGQPSPILPDGTLLSLPIPQPEDTVRFTDLSHAGKSYCDIITELNPRTRQINNGSFAHLDPDIRHEAYANHPENWKAIFGQCSSAQRHLENQGATTGDIFLFFGWFKQAEIINGKLKYKMSSPDLHVIFGYMQIGSIFKCGDSFPEYGLQHSHYHPRHARLPTNCIYVAADRLSFDESLPGHGTLNFRRNLILTKLGMTRGKWQLADFFKELNISYHNTKSFKDGYFKSADKGQEFVIQENEQVEEWVKELIGTNV